LAEPALGNSAWDTAIEVPIASSPYMRWTLRDDVDVDDVDVEDVDMEDVDVEDVDMEDVDVEDVDCAEAGSVAAPTVWEPTTARKPERRVHATNHR
jgi:hypothetical protein